MNVLAEIERERRAEHERAIDRNCRILELARHNGYELDVFDRPDLGPGAKLWLVPRELYTLAGAMGLVVR